MKTGKRKGPLAALLILVLILISVGFIIPKLVDLNRYKGWLVSTIEDAVEGEVTIGHITWGISKGIWLRTDQFSITKSSAFPVDLNLTHLYARVAVLPLLSKNIEIEELTLDGPGVVIKLKPGPEEPGTGEPETNKRVVLDDKISQEFNNEALGLLLPIGISVSKLSIKNGRIRIENELTLPGQRLVHNLKAVKIDALDIIPGREITFSFSLEGDAAEGFGSLQAQGSFTGLSQTFIIEDPKIKLKALLSSFDTKVLNPYLKGSFLDNKFGGIVSLDIKYEGDLLSHHSVEGSVDLSDFRFHSPSLGGELFFEGKTKIGCRAFVDPNDIRIKALDIRIKNNRVNADGLIKNWNEKPIVEDLLVSASLFSGELVGLIPWKIMNRYVDNLVDSLRPALEAGGQLEIEKFGIGSIPLTGPFPDPMDFLSQLKLVARVSKISIPPMPGILQGMPKIEQVSGSIELDQGSVTLKDFQFKTSYSPASIEALNARVDLTQDRINIEKFSTTVVIPKGGSETQFGRFSIKLAGRLDDWQKEPVALVQSLSTSSIPLNPVASIIPWDQIPWDQIPRGAGKNTGFLKEVLLAGGSLKINNFSLPGINLIKPSNNIQKVISKTKAGLDFSDIKIRPGPAYPLFDGISGNVTFDKGVLNISEIRSRMGPLTLPSIRVQASGFNDDLEVTASIKGPVKVLETDNKKAVKFLMERGFKRFTGGAEIDLDFTYFQNQPDDWVAKGSLMLESINAESFPTGIQLHNAQGKIFFSRAETTEISVENLSATIDDAPVKLSGKLTNGRTKDMVMDGKVNIKKLDLAELNSLVPYLDYLTFTGILDVDLDFKIPFDSPADTKLDGRVNGSGIGFHLPDHNTKVKDTNIQIELASHRVDLANMDMTINDQLFHLKGSAFDPAAPRISLSLKSPNLDVDQLLAWDNKMTEQSEPADSIALADPLGHQDSDIPEGDHKQELPQWAANLKADLQIEIDNGKYHDQLFKDLNLLAHYEKGILQNYGVNFLLANGKIITTGSADLRNPGKISFTMNPDISNVQIGELSSLFKVEKMPLDGPLSITGRIEGEAGDQVLLSSLKGALEADVGAGRMPEVKKTGKLLTKIFSFINLNGLFSGALTNKIQNEGIPFKAIKSEVRFSKGNMNLENFIFISNSLNGNSQGVINFPDEKIGLQVVLEPLQTIDNLLGWVPILGKQAQKLTKVHLTVAGDLYNPEVRTVLTKGFTEAIMGTLKIPGAVFKKSEELSGEIDAYIKEELEENNAQ